VLRSHESERITEPGALIPPPLQAQPEGPPPAPLAQGGTDG
jgi:hypothetical protein